MLHLISCGCNYIHQKGFCIRRPNGAGNYAFVFFRRDSRVHLDGEWVTAPRDSYILYRPETPQLYRELDPPFVNDWFHCDGDDAAAFFQSLAFPLDIPVSAGEPMALSRRILELGVTMRQQGPFQREILDCELRSLFYRLCCRPNCSASVDAGHRHLRRLTLLRNELYGRPQERPSIDELSARSGLSRSYFQHIYKNLFGVSVMQDMINSRMEYAKYLLQSGSLSVGEVAGQCGYENDVHFIRQFKKTVGYTPSRYAAAANAKEGTGRTR